MRRHVHSTHPWSNQEARLDPRAPLLLSVEGGGAQGPPCLHLDRVIASSRDIPMRQSWLHLRTPCESAPAAARRRPCRAAGISWDRRALMAFSAPVGPPRNSLETS